MVYGLHALVLAVNFKTMILCLSSELAVRSLAELEDQYR